MYSYIMFTQWYFYFNFQILFTRLNQLFLGCKKSVFTAENVFDFSFLHFKSFLAEICFVAYLVDYLATFIFGLIFRFFSKVLSPFSGCKNQFSRKVIKINFGFALSLLNLCAFLTLVVVIDLVVVDSCYCLVA